MGSVRRRGGAVRVDLDPAEVVLLASLVSQVRELLSESSDGSSAVLERLLPDAYRDDAEAAAEYRELMDAELRQQKGAALQRVLDDLAGNGTAHGKDRRFELDDDTITLWLYALNDVRLSLGTILDVSQDWEDEVSSLDPDSPRFAGLGVYEWAGWLQQSIVEAASGG
jgi:hypothetical protein